MKAAILLAAALAAANAAAADLERGRAVWNYRCYFCHGYSGDAKTLATRFVQPPPRDFRSADPAHFPMPRLLNGIRNGIPGTTMKPFANVLTEREIVDVAAFLRSEFLEKRAPNTRYHTKEAGWPDHERYADAFPFARGDLPLDGDERALDAAQRRGKRMFLQACITCHDRSHVLDEGLPWQAVKK